MVEHAVDLVRAGQDGQAAQLGRAVADRRPGRPGIEAALEVDVVLVDGRGVLGVLREPQTRDLLRMRQHRLAGDTRDHVHDLRLVRGAMEGFEIVDRVIDVGVALVALGADARHVGDAVHRVRVRQQPAAFLHHRQHLTPQFHHHVRILQALEEEVALVGEPPAQLVPVQHGVIGDAQFFQFAVHFLCSIKNSQSQHRGV